MGITPVAEGPGTYKNGVSGGGRRTGKSPRRLCCAELLLSFRWRKNTLVLFNYILLESCGRRSVPTVLAAEQKWTLRSVGAWVAQVTSDPVFQPLS